MQIHGPISPKNRTISGLIAHEIVSKPAPHGKVSEFRTRN
jgi:hypothetical protein